jgi:hypothetical protein
MCSSWGDIDYAPMNEWATIIDPDNDGTPGISVGDSHHHAERKRWMGCCHPGGYA